MKRFVQIACVMLASTSLLAACGTATPSASPAATNTAAAAAAKPTAAAAQPTTVQPGAQPTPMPAAAKVAKPTGALTIAISSFNELQFDAMLTGVQSFLTFGYAVFDPLVGIGPGGSPAPGIAERWEMSPDGKTWTFYIRKGVKFQDGSDLTAADVKFSLERTWAPDSKNSFAGNLRTLVQSVVVKDDYTVALNLNTPQGELYSQLIGAIGDNAVIVPKKYIEEKGVDYFRKHPIGSGPWKVVDFDSSTYVNLEAVGNWRATPQFKNVKLMAVPEQATRIAMLKTGQVDMAEISSDAVSEVKAAGLRVSSYNGGNQATIALYYDNQHPEAQPFGDVRVRKAMSLSINRQEIADKLFGGYARPFAQLNVPPTIYFFDPKQIAVDPYDPDQAKKLLTEAGYPNGFSTKIQSIPWSASYPTLAEAVAGYWSKIGAKTDIVPMEWSAWRPLWIENKPQTWGTATTINTAGKATFELRGQYWSKANAKNHNNAKLDELIEQTEAAIDPTLRKQLALQAAVEAENTYSNIALVTFDSIWAQGKQIGDWKPIDGTTALAVNLETITHAR